MTERQLVSSGSPYEPLFGFSRAVRAGEQVAVSGTAAIEPDGTVTAGGMRAQAARCLAIIEGALSEAGASLGDVMRTRIYVTDVSRWEEAAHAAVFGSIRPAATIVEVQALVDPAMLVEIEADAVVGSGGGG